MPDERRNGDDRPATETPPAAVEKAPTPAAITDEELPMPEDEGEPRGGVGEMVRRALLAGVGAVFMTEENIRKTMADLKVPKEAFSYLVGQADRTRTEATRILRNEVRRFLNSEAFRKELVRLLSGLTLEIKAEVRLRPEGSREAFEGTLKVKAPTREDRNR